MIAITINLLRGERKQKRIALLINEVNSNSPLYNSHSLNCLLFKTFYDKSFFRCIELNANKRLPWYVS